MKTSLHPSALLALAAGSFLPFYGCSVEQTEEGEMPTVDVDAESGQMPEYRVVQTQEGEMPEVDIDAEAGNWPEYDIDWADVDAGLATTTVTVPEVNITYEEEEVTVPYVNIDWPGEEETERQVVNIAVRTPNDGYEAKIEEIHLLDGTLHILARVEAGDDQSTASGIRPMQEDMAVMDAPADVEKQIYVYGDLSDVAMPASYEKIDSPRAFREQTRDGERIYPRS